MKKADPFFIAFDGFGLGVSVTQHYWLLTCLFLLAMALTIAASWAEHAR